MTQEKGKFTVVLVQGPPGSGKGTQSEILAKELGYYHFISSQVGKDYMKTHDDHETVEQKTNYGKGLLFKPSWIFKVVMLKSKEIFEQSGGEGGIVYDGSPRTLYEAENLYSFLVDLVGKENIRVIKIDVGEEELQRRLEKRLICDKSGNHVFVSSEDLQPGSPCPEGDGVLQKRDLDKKELFATRISEFKNRTMPGLNFLQERLGVITVNGEQDVEKIHENIMSELNLS